MSIEIDRLETVRVEGGTDGITWLWMNRPDKLNAMTPQMHAEMRIALDAIEEDDETRVVVLTGAGRAFCAGQDIQKNFRESRDQEIARGVRRRRDTDWRFDRLYYYQKPTIAMVNGWCCGGAFTQLFSCDFAIAADDAEFCISEVNWGIIPGGLVSKVVAEGVGYRDALYNLLLAETFTGTDAARMGFVNFAVPPEDLRAATVELAEKIMAKNLATYLSAKEAFKAVLHMNFAQSNEYLRAKSAELRLTDRSRGREQGMKGFLDDKVFKPGKGPYPKAPNGG